MCKRSFLSLTLLLFSVVLYSQTNIEQYNGIVNDNAVRIREAPYLEGKIIGQLNQGMSVTVLGRSENRMFLDGYDSYWLKIKKDNAEGWSYGAYINLLDSQYDLLPVMSTVKPNGPTDLSPSRNLPIDEFIRKEKETLNLQASSLYNCTVEEYYNAIVKAFNQQQSLRPFFLNTHEVGIAYQDSFFYFSSSRLCDFIQTSYSSNITISPLNVHNKTSATFMISGFKKQAAFIAYEISAIAINIKRIDSTNFIPLNGRAIIDWIILNPYTPEDAFFFQGDADKYYSFMTSMPIFLMRSDLLQMILD